MAKTIWKYDLEPDGSVIEMPQGAKPLSVQMQGDGPCLWALVDPEAAKESRRFHVAGTGHPLPDNLGDHLGTFQMNGGALVFHVFELLDQKGD
jgi:hypothetical protein